MLFCNNAILWGMISENQGDKVHQLALQWLTLSIKKKE